jgi:uncharacterized protein (TIGR03067 family)
MRTHALMLVVIGSWLAASVSPAAADDTEKELKKFEGTWLLVSSEHNGQQLPKDDLKDFRLTIKGDQFTSKQGTMTIAGTLKIDPSQKPKVVDATATQDGKKVASLGIYELDGDAMKVCYVAEGSERPKAFSTKGGTNDKPVMLDVYKREKAK